MKYLRKIETENDKYTIKDVPNIVLVTDVKKVLYNIQPTSVFIHHINGTIYTMEEWQSYGFTGDKANGVAVIDDKASFVIAKEDLAESAWATDTTTNIDGILNTGTKSEAANDYAGLNNTTLMLAVDTNGVGYLCANYSFPNGQKGYLGAAGEWCIAYAYKDELNQAMELIGGALFQKSYWTSTQCRYLSNSNAWITNWSGDYAFGLEEGDGKMWGNPVRPFTTLTL